MSLEDLGVPPDPLKGPVQAALIEHDPIVILVYTLMKRGTVTPQAFSYVVKQVREGSQATDVYGPRDKGLLSYARELCEQLPVYR